MSKFLLHTFARLVAHLRPQGRGGGDGRKSGPNCLVIWLFCYHHYKSRMGLIESSRKVYFLYSYEKAERKKRKEKKKLMVLLASSGLNLGPFFLYFSLF